MLLIVSRPEPFILVDIVLLITNSPPCAHLVYISGRPFVLRDASEPRRTLALSDRAQNLEAIESRMKNDILEEATK